MYTKRSSKLNQLLTQWQRGTVYTQSHLTRLGYYHDLIKSYRRSGWLQSIGRGAYILPNDPVDFYGGLFALQRQLQLPVHIGGRTALELKGYAHYGRIAGEKCFLYSTRGTRIPAWFVQVDWGVEIQFKATSLLSNEFAESFSDYEHKEFTIRISAPERAAIEMLYYIPSQQGFDEALRILEGLMTLRPKLVQKLLENCKSVKVKRLFLYMSEKLAMPWFAELNPGRISLGSGKRVIVANGVLDKKYLITVPRSISS